MNRESQNIEWKEAWHDDYLKWVSGFANAQGGIIVLGKKDDGTPVRGRTSCPCYTQRYGRNMDRIYAFSATGFRSVGENVGENVGEKNRKRRRKSSLSFRKIR